MVNEGSGTPLDTYLSNPREGEISFPKIESGMPIASHEQIRCDQHTDGVVDAWNLGGANIMVYENRNCQAERSKARSLRSQNLLTLHPSLPLICLISI